jgi:MFS family permease
MFSISIGKFRSLVITVAPLAAAYFASYFFRTVNALISEDLVHDLGLNAGQLGLLTSAYFLTFAMVQIPAGLLLDRFGPRRVQVFLLAVAAVGAGLFAFSKSFALLLFARACIGLGVAASLVAGLKAIALWFPKDRVSLVNGIFIAIGTFGVVAATAPSEILLHFIGWRTLFVLLAIFCVVCAVFIFYRVPETQAAPRTGAIRIASICSDPRFWRVAPLSMMCISTAWALQGLWAAPWFSDVDHLDHHSVVKELFVMAIALSIAALGLGVVADKLRRHGVRPQTLLAAIAVLFIATQLALLLAAPLPSLLLWTFIAGTGAATVVSYSIMGDLFPKEISGQANGALNTLHIGGAFAIQAGIGMIVAHWTSVAGHYPPIAYKVAIGVNLLLQMLALIWFLLPSRILSVLSAQTAVSPEAPTSVAI